MARFFDSQHWKIIASAPDQSLDFVRLQGRRTADDGGDPSSLWYADYLRFLVTSGRDQGNLPSEMRGLEPLADEADRLMRIPESCSRLPHTTLKLLAYDRILRYGFANGINQKHDQAAVGMMMTLYKVLLERFMIQDRLLLLSDVGLALRCNEREPLAFFAFIYAETSSEVIAKASERYATLLPATHDAMDGPGRVSRLPTSLQAATSIWQQDCCKDCCGSVTGASCLSWTDVGDISARAKRTFAPRPRRHSALWRSSRSVCAGWTA